MASGWEIGSLVETAPAKRPERVNLEGRLVTLMPLTPELHGRALYQKSHGPEADALWRYMSDGPYPGPAAFEAALRRKADSADPLFYAVVPKATGIAAGYASYLRIDPAYRSIEVGNILFAPELQRTAESTEAMYLMARYVFEELGYRRYEWKCNSLNAPSRSAALRLGFQFEGIFRQHMIVKGRNRDTAWYSMLDSEWPARKAAFERWLASDNFDAEGRQKTRLRLEQGTRSENAVGVQAPLDGSH